MVERNALGAEDANRICLYVKLICLCLSEKKESFMCSKADDFNLNHGKRQLFKCHVISTECLQKQRRAEISKQIALRSSTCVK